MKRILPLAVFPAIQTTCFVGAGLTWASTPWLSIGLFMLAVLALDLTVHIFLHEVVHASPPERLPWAASLGLSLLGGMPFDGYRLHHYNHHRHDNGPGDYSSTWLWEADGRRRPKRLLSYVLLWPIELGRARAAMREDALAGRLSLGMQKRLRTEKNVIGLFLIALALYSWPWALAYVGLVYAGWALVSLHNFGQHLPLEGQAPVTSLANRPYNAALFNNGLHGEHHAEPGKAWHDLRAEPSFPRARGPHLLLPLGDWRRGAVPAEPVEPPRP